MTSKPFGACAFPGPNPEADGRPAAARHAVGGLARNLSATPIPPRPESPLPNTASTRTRIDSVDVLRGIIMILMALDHTRDYFGNAAVNPTQLAVTTVPLFFTRWITNICAPVFFLLTGTGAALALRHRTRAGLSQFLWTRGLWLIFLELTVMRAFWQFNVDYHVTILTVLWALGWSMIALAALVWLPVRAIAAIGVIMIAGHNLLDGVQASSFGALAPVWSVLHSPNVLFASADHLVFVAYPLIPWIGVTAMGFVLGQIYAWPAERRVSVLLRLGAALTVAFVALRAANVYGDPSRWAPQHSAAFTLLSFLDTTKYPPSLLFLLMTLGPALVILALVERDTPRALRPALIIGKVPMFYYVVHVLVIHVAAVIACYARYGAVHWMFESPKIENYPVTQPPGWPASLPVVWLLWIGVVIVLYPLCRWYAALKQRRRDLWWLSYL